MGVCVHANDQKAHTYLERECQIKLTKLFSLIRTSHDYQQRKILVYVRILYNTRKFS